MGVGILLSIRVLPSKFSEKWICAETKLIAIPLIMQSCTYKSGPWILVKSHFLKQKRLKLQMPL